MNRKEHWRAFDHEWFRRNQRVILWLLAAPVLGRICRWMLRIRPHDVGYRGQIIQVMPHAYTILRGVADDGRIIVTTDFRTHWKYSKRVYYSLRPVWWTMHAWDWLLADRWLPSLSFGFNKLAFVPDANPETTCVDGYVEYFPGDNTWSTIIGGTDGTDVQDAIDSAWFFYFAAANAASNMWVRSTRSFLLFDTSVIGADSIISDANITLYCSTRADPTSNLPSAGLYSSSPASNTALALGDYDQIGSTLFSELTYGQLVVSSYCTFALNSSGLSNISQTGISKFGIKNKNYDGDAVAPTWQASATTNASFRAADYAGNSFDPKLIVTYGMRGEILPPHSLRPGFFNHGIAR